MTTTQTNHNIISTKAWKRHCSLDINSIHKDVYNLISELGETGRKLSGDDIRIIANFQTHRVFDEETEMTLLERFYEIKKRPKSSCLEVLVLKYGKIEGTRLREEFSNKSKQTLQSYIRKWGELEGPKKYKEYCIKKTHSLDGFVMRHGSVEGPKKYKEYWAATNFSTSKDAFIRRHGTVLGVKKYNEYIKTISNWASGRSWESEEKYKEFINKRSRSIKLANYSNNHDTLSLCAFRRRYGEVDGEREYNKFWQYHKSCNPITLDYWFKLGYNREEALIKQSEEQQKRLNKPTPYRASKSSLKVFLPLYKLLRRIGYIEPEDVNFGISGSNEYMIRHDGRGYYYDFTIPKYNVIIEFHGILWHYRENAPKHPFMTNEESKTHDQLKEEIARHAGFEYFVIWEDDSAEDVKKVFQAIVGYIGNYENKN